MQKKCLRLSIILGVALYLSACSVSTEEDVNPKTLDFTGRGTVGSDNAFDHTNGVEINNESTSDPMGDKRMQVSRIDQNDINLSSQTKITLEEITADQVKLIDEVAEATILETDNNAYVAVKLQQKSAKLTEELQMKITQIVQANVKHADAVYISNSPDFKHRMDGYSNSIKAARPTSFIIDDFSETIRRIFPDAR